MSLILKALKKSEQERQVGRVPGLDSQPMHMAREPRSHHARWPWLLLVAAVLMTGAWWLGQESAREEGLRPPVLPTVAPPTETQPVTQSPTPAALGQSKTAAVPPVQPMVSESPKEPEQPKQTSAKASRPKPQTPARSENTAPVRQAKAEAPKPSKPLPPPTPASKPVKQSDTLPSVASSASEPSATTRATTRIASDTHADKPRLPRVAELPVAERQSLPTLKQSMHIYAAEPIRRAIIIDGKRYAEGDVMQPDLTVEHIRRDGTVLRWEGRQLLLKRP